MSFPGDTKETVLSNLQVFIAAILLIGLISLAYGAIHLRLASVLADSPERARLESWRRLLGKLDLTAAAAAFFYFLVVLTDWQHPIQKYPPPLVQRQPGEPLLMVAFFVSLVLVALHVACGARLRSVARWRFPDVPGLHVKREWNNAQKRQAHRDFDRWIREVGAPQDEDLRRWHRVDQALTGILFLSAVITAGLFLRVFLPAFLAALEKAG